MCALLGIWIDMLVRVYIIHVYHYGMKEICREVGHERRA